MLTIVMAVYGQPLMLAKQLATIESYPDDVLDKLTVIVVDDHGDPPVTVEAMQELGKFCKVKLFRVDEDIPWNQMGARNIGMREAEGVCVMLDPDMVIERSMIAAFMSRAKTLRTGKVVKFALSHSDPDRELDYSSPNTWMLHKSDFFAVGGYDEDFAGHKGWSDCLLQETLRAFFPIENSKALHVTFHLPRDGISDAQVQVAAGVDRSVSHNKQLKRAKNKLIDKSGGFRKYINRQVKPPNFRCQVTRLL